MNKFNKRSLCVALAATGLLGAGGAAQAVNLNSDGTGNVLIYPYYTVRANASESAFNTYLSVTNSTGSTKAVKVRFREGRNSHEVLDFNVFLSPYDIWTGGVVPTADGAAILTFDRTCSIPQLRPGIAEPFRNIRYSGTADDGAGTTLDRTREGYVEIFEMATYVGDSDIAAGAKHDEDTGVPTCDGVTDDNAQLEGRPPQGGLFGMMQLINPGLGASMSTNAVALDNFYPPLPAVDGQSFYANTGNIFPNMADAAGNSAVVSGTTLTVSTDWSSQIDAVSAVLMRNAVMNEYVLEKGTLSKTDWVVTFPTKNFYVGPSSARPPFESGFDENGSCDTVLLSLRDREEREPRAGSGPGPDFSPQDPLDPDVASICWEANVITFNADAPTLGVLGSKNVGINVNTNLQPTPTEDYAQNGWLRLGFGFTNSFLVNSTSTQVNLTTGAATSGLEVTYAGLPVVGFNVFSYTNTALKVGSVTYNLPVNYGMGVDHKYERRILSTTAP